MVISLNSTLTITLNIPSDIIPNDLPHQEGNEHKDSTAVMKKEATAAMNAIYKNNTNSSTGAINDRFCAAWDQTMDDWWSHHPDWDVVNESDEGICFKKLPNNEKTLFFHKMYQNQNSDNVNCSAVYTRYMWCSGWNADFSNIVDGMHVALEMGQPLAMKLVRYAQWWHYSANKAPSGRHLGHYKAVITDDELLEMYAQLLTIPFWCGFGLELWKYAIQVMLEKLPGWPWIEKL
jgi:hypothetical protein